MKNLPKPNDNHLDVLEECISTIRSAKVKADFKLVSKIIMDAGDDYDELIQRQQLYTFPASNNIGLNISKTEMNKLYTNKLAKLGEPARAYYDKWKLVAPNGKCPLCGVREVRTLDHYLPKGKHPIFAILPINLIPACRDCNTDKLAEIATCYAEETIHPYYDDIDGEQWLQATIGHTSPAKFIYRVNPPPTWSAYLIGRVNTHLRVFKLNNLYSSHAAEELSNINGQLRKVFQSGGPDAVREHIKEGLDSRLLANVNSWQTGMYKAMYMDVWFHHNCFF
jgi:hypothetical protein